MNIKTFTQLLTAIATTTTALLVSSHNLSYAATVTQILGDIDFFGFDSGTIGNPVPTFDFNNQEPDDPAFTDRDIRLGNPSNDTSWTHDLSTELRGMNITDVVLTLPIGGIQDGNSIFGSLNDRLFIENIEVIGAFDSVDQGTTGTGLFNFTLTSTQIASLQTDFQLDIFIDGGIVPPDASAGIGVLDSFFLDYSEVNITTTPQSVPESSNILGLIVVGAGFVFTGIKCKKNKEQEN